MKWQAWNFWFILFKSGAKKLFVVAFTLQLFTEISGIFRSWPKPTGSIFVVIDQRQHKEISLRANIHMPGCYRMENGQKITNSNVNGCLDVQFPFMQGGYRRGKCESTEGKAYWQTNWGRDFQGFVLIHTLWSDSTSLKQHWINQSGISSFSKK